MGPREFAIDPNTIHPIIDPSLSYSTTGVNTTASPAILSIAGVGSYVVQMDTTHFLDTGANEQSILYQQIGIGPARDGGFMDGLDSGEQLVVLWDPMMVPQQTDVADISLMVFACLTLVANDDGAWKFWAIE
jgi:hypothetical protein